MIVITKNTISKGIEEFMDKNKSKYARALMMANETLRSEIVKPLDFPVDTGRLKGSIGQVNKIVADENGGESKLGTRVQYADFVEFGTSRMKGRHYMEKGFNLAEPKIRAIIKKQLSV